MERFDESSNEIVLENCNDFLPATVDKVLQYFYKGKLGENFKLLRKFVRFIKMILYDNICVIYNYRFGSISGGGLNKILKNYPLPKT